LSTATVQAHEHAEPNSVNSEISFIENKGQWNAQAKFKAIIPGGEMYITPDGFLYNFYDLKDVERVHNMTCGTGNQLGGEKTANEVINMHAYKVNFVGANTSSTLSYKGEAKKSSYVNYFLG